MIKASFFDPPLPLGPEDVTGMHSSNGAYLNTIDPLIEAQRALIAVI